MPSSYFLIPTPNSAGFSLIDLYGKRLEFDVNGNSTLSSIGIDRIPCMIQAGFKIDSGFILSGYTSLVSGISYPVLVNMNNDGEVQWIQATDLGQYSLSNSYVTKSTDGGYFSGGMVRDEVTRKYCGFIQKSDSMGNSLWVKIFNSSNKFIIKDIMLTINGDLIGRSVTNDEGAGLIKIDSSGNVLWAKSLEDSSFSIAITITKDQNYIICGQTFINDNLYAAKFDSAGVLLWYHEYIGENCFPFQVIERKNGELVFVGSTGSNNGFFFIAESNGNPIYSSEITTDTFNHSLYIQNVIEMEDSSCVLYGRGNFASNNFAELLYKVNSNDLEKCYSNPFQIQSVQQNYVVGDDSVTSFFISSFSYPVPFNNLIESITQSSDICKISPPVISDDISIFPNPAFDYIVLSNYKSLYFESIEIINSVGQVVFSRKEGLIENNGLRLSFDLASGLYFLNIVSSEKNATFKLLICKQW